MRHQSSADRHSFAIESYFREQKIRYYLLFIYYFIISLFIYIRTVLFQCLVTELYKL
jgi:hypothetical protein